MRYIKCWVCQSWTSERFIEKFDFDGAEADVCIECAEKIRLQERKLDAMRRGAQGNATQTGGTLQDQLSPLAGGPPGDGPDSKGAGDKPEPVGAGADPPGGAVQQKDKCTTPGCPGIAVYTQMYKDRYGKTHNARRCREHRDDRSGVDPTWELEGFKAFA